MQQFITEYNVIQNRPNPEALLYKNLGERDVRADGVGDVYNGVWDIINEHFLSYIIYFIYRIKRTLYTSIL